MYKRHQIKTNKKFLTSYSILLLIIVIVGIISQILSQFDSNIHAVNLSEIIKSPVLGMIDSVKIGLFLIIFGGCMGIIDEIDAINTGIKCLIKRLNGHEIKIVPAIMAIFALLGTTNGFYSETIPFYALLAATLYAAGYDTMVSSAAVLFGAGVGCLGSSVNPFANGIAIETLDSLGIDCNPYYTILLGLLLCTVSYFIALFYILKYAKKVKQNPDSSILTEREREESKEAFGQSSSTLEDINNATLNTKQKTALVLFTITFVIMVIGFIPWKDFGITVFEAGQTTTSITEKVNSKELEETWDKSKDSKLDIKNDVDATSTNTKVKTPAWSSLITGKPMGTWFFVDASVWFFFMTIVIALCSGLSENQAVDAFIDGASKIVGVALIIGLARGLNLILIWSHLDLKILNDASAALANLPPEIIVPMSYLVYLALSVVITSTSALAAVSMPIMGPLAVRLGLAPEIMVMIFVAANGLANLFSPAGFFLPGLVLAKVAYPTYLKWARKPIITIGITSVLILTIAAYLI